MLAVLAPGLAVDGGAPEDLDLAACLAYQPARDGYLFALVRLTSGRYAAVWQRHAAVRDSLEELTTADPARAVLNLHERALAG